MLRIHAMILLLTLLPAPALAGAPPRGVQTWFVDPLVKVFPGDPPGKHRLVAPEFWGARNDYVSVQLAIRAARPLAGISAEVGTLEGPSGARISGAQVQYVGYVIVASHSPDTPPEELVGEAPGWYPDPLLDFPFDLDAGKTHSLWATIRVPRDATPGLYRGTITVRAGVRTVARVGFRLRVVKAVVPEERSLKVTNWFFWSDQTFRQFYGLTGPSFTPQHWKLLENIGRVMAERRQNVMLTPLMDLAEARIEAGELRYDFTNLDRWVETFRRAGLIGYIEGSHLVGRAGGYNAPLEVPTFQIDGGQVRRLALPPDDPRVERFLAGFLSTLNKHLEERGWKDIYFQHILDEAHGDEPPVYGRIAELVRRHLPGVLTIDAVDAEHMPEVLQQSCDLWVPLLGRFDQQMDLLERRLASGREVWFYTCLVPRGRYPNRLMDYSLLKVRLLHWLNFRFKLTGFLHWGANWWTPEPMLATQPIINDNQTLLPAGDAFIVYPDRANLSVRSSIRLEAMRDGIEDYELLRQLAQKNPAEADRLARAAMTSFTEYVRDPAAFRKIERRLLEALSQ